MKWRGTPLDCLAALRLMHKLRGVYRGGIFHIYGASEDNTGRSRQFLTVTSGLQALRAPGLPTFAACTLTNDQRF